MLLLGTRSTEGSEAGETGVQGQRGTRLQQGKIPAWEALLRVFIAVLYHAALPYPVVGQRLRELLAFLACPLQALAASRWEGRARALLCCSWATALPEGLPALPPSTHEQQSQSQGTLWGILPAGGFCSFCLGVRQSAVVRAPSPAFLLLQS